MTSPKDELIFALSQGPAHNVKTYQSYDINGYTFYTEEKDSNCEFQNSGVTMECYETCEITAADVKQVQVASDSLSLVGWQYRDKIVGTYAKGTIYPGMLVTTQLLDSKPPVGDGRVIVSVLLNPALTPKELARGDLVQVVRASGSSATSSPSRRGSRTPMVHGRPRLSPITRLSPPAATCAWAMPWRRRIAAALSTAWPLAKPPRSIRMPSRANRTLRVRASSASPRQPIAARPFASADASGATPAR